MQRRTKEQRCIDLELGSKVCTKCGERKDFSRFSRDNSSEDNTRSWCKSCVRNNVSKYTHRSEEDLQYDICTQTKTCARCEVRKPFIEFYILRTAKDGRTYKCKVCEVASKQECQKRNRNKYQTLSRLQSLKKLYNISDVDLMNLMDTQRGCCVICGETLVKGTGAKNDTFFIDHNHETGEVRGLLCLHCNAMLGQAKDSPTILQKGIDYLNERGYYGE